MKPIRISPLSLVVGALLAFGLFLVMGQAGPSTDVSWGPLKKGMVNIFQVQTVPMPAGASHVVYQVPADRWLTVTGTAVNNDGGNDMLWSEVLAGVLQDKGVAGIDATQSLPTTPAGSGAAVGWVFRPGSQVVIRNAGTSGHQISRVCLIGYESRD
jgi:hypothetical protein